MIRIVYASIFVAAIINPIRAAAVNSGSYDTGSALDQISSQ